MLGLKNGFVTKHEKLRLDRMTEQKNLNQKVMSLHPIERVVSPRQRCSHYRHLKSWNQIGKKYPGRNRKLQFASRKNCENGGWQNWRVLCFLGLTHVVSVGQLHNNFVSVHPSCKEKKCNIASSVRAPAGDVVGNVVTKMWKRRGTQFRNCVSCLLLGACILEIWLWARQFSRCVLLDRWITGQAILTLLIANQMQVA